jgi:flagellar protein FliO/FliZ
MSRPWSIPMPGCSFALKCLASCLASITLAHAQQARSGVSAAAVSSPMSSFLQLLFALAVVLGVIGLFAWGLRRLSLGQRLGGGLVKVRGGVMLGPKERVVLVEVADTWIVVGVGGGQISALHAMPRPDNSPEDTDALQSSPNLGSWLRQNLPTKKNPDS